MYGKRLACLANLCDPGMRSTSSGKNPLLEVSRDYIEAVLDLDSSIIRLVDVLNDPGAKDCIPYLVCKKVCSLLVSAERPVNAAHIRETTRALKARFNPNSWTMLAITSLKTSSGRSTSCMVSYCGICFVFWIAQCVELKEEVERCSRSD
jgi:hypothetical protein